MFQNESYTNPTALLRLLRLASPKLNTNAYSCYYIKIQSTQINQDLSIRLSQPTHSGAKPKPTAETDREPTMHIWQLRHVACK